MSEHELRFGVAGLDVQMRGSGLDVLGGHYGEYPTTGQRPTLILDIEAVPDFARDREPGPAHPGFDVAVQSPHAIRFSRWDAEGTLVLRDPDSEAIRARFRVADNKNAVEAALRACASIALPARGGLIMHASAVAANGRALIFAGESGAGKSTLSKLLESEHVPRISDELLIVSRARDPWVVHVTPFIGSDGLPHGTAVPLTAIHFLQQAPEHRRVRLDTAPSIPALIRNVMAYAVEPTTAQRILDIATALATDIPCYRLEFAKNPDVAEVLDITC